MAVRLHLANANMRIDGTDETDVKLSVVNGVAHVHGGVSTPRHRQLIATKEGVVSIDAQAPQYRVLFSDGTVWSATRTKGCNCGG